MNKKKLMITALLLTLCAAASLTSCGRTDANTDGTQNDNNGERVTTAPAETDKKEPDNGIVGDIESGIEDIGSDIENSVGNPEDATHGKTDNNTEGNNGNMSNEMTPNTGNAPGARHRKAVPNGK
jgi:hypothetical protein